MQTKEASIAFKKGVDAAEKGYIDSAYTLLGQAAAHINSPELHSYQAYCLARGEGRIQAAVKTCRESIRREPGNSIHYLILGRILLLAGEKESAIRTFRRGLKASPNPKIIAELKKLGLRKPAVLSNLERNHLLNRILGRVLHRIGIR